MNARNRAARCEARPDLHDSLKPYERTVLALWDGGMAVGDIAAQLDVADRSVERIVEMFDDRPEIVSGGSRLSEREDAVRRDGLFVARLLAFQAHVAFGKG